MTVTPREARNTRAVSRARLVQQSTSPTLLVVPRRLLFPSTTPTPSMSTTAPRRPLVQRPHLSHNGGRAPVRAPSSGAKRPRSPEPEYTSSQIKRSRASTKWTRDTLTWQERGERVAAREREQQRLEFKDKYSRAFPSWSFYFDNENISMKQTQLAVLVNRIGQLHGVNIMKPLSRATRTDMVIIER